MTHSLKKTDRCIQIGIQVGGGGYVISDQGNRIYSTEGISPTICSFYEKSISGFKIAIYEQKANPNSK